MPPKRILLVDDSSTVLSLEKLMLRDSGYELHTARDGAEVPEQVNRCPPDLILLDVVMPKVNGIECCRRLKADAATQRIPVIMVTTKGNQAIVSDAFAAGCDDFVTKPIDKVELLDKIRTHIGSG